MYIFYLRISNIFSSTFGPSPSNWYWMMLLKTSSRKKTRWWFCAEVKRNQGVEKASRRWSSLLAATMDRLFR